MNNSAISGGGSATASPQLSSLIATQNADGGWPYLRGESWTEPTVYALLALAVEQPRSGAIARGASWLTKARARDGGWPPSPSVAKSTWVTALGVMLFAQLNMLKRNDPALEWLLRVQGRESTGLFRLRRWLLGGRSEYREEHPGWPWFPEAAAWVAPTALTILALQKAKRRLLTNDFDRRIEDGRKFLRSHACADGGWNHGSSRALGYDSASYPETTGVALLALQGIRSALVERAIACAENHLRSARSSEAVSWLRLGLQAHGKAAAANIRPRRHTLGVALHVLEQAAINGRNVFVDKS